MSDPGSVTNWIAHLQEGEQSIAQQQVWNRYFQSLVNVARNKMRDANRRELDEEDAVLSAFDSFFQRVQNGQFPDLQDRTSLWPLLVKITVRKALNQQRRAMAQKRRASGESVVANDQENARWMEQVAGQQPTPEMVAETTEQAHHLLDQLEGDSYRSVAQLKLEGYTNKEIAEQLGVIERTIERRLVHIRNVWSQYIDADY